MKQIRHKMDITYQRKIIWWHIQGRKKLNSILKSSYKPDLPKNLKHKSQSLKDANLNVKNWET